MRQEQVIYNDDEISLVDLIVVLLKRKWIVLSVLALCLIGASIFAVAREKPDQYKYSSSLEIGSFLSEGQIVSIDSAINLSAKIEEVYAPQIQAQSTDNVGVAVRTPKGSNLVIIESSGAADQQKIVREAHNKLVTMIQDEQSRHANELGIELMRKTQPLGEPREAVTASDTKKNVILVLGLVMGIILGIFAAFLIEFAGNLRRQLKEKTS